MKKILALVACLSLVASLAIGGSIAYLTDRDSEANVFTMGNVEIDLVEKFEPNAELLPGVTVDKQAHIVNTGDNNAYVWMTIAIPEGFYQCATPGTGDENNAPTLMDAISTALDTTGWTRLDDDTVEIEGQDYDLVTLLYNKALAPDGETNEVLGSVTLSEYVDINTNGDMYLVLGGNVTSLNWNVKTDGNPIVYVSAYAIQEEGFATAQLAYDAYNEQWGDNGTEYAAPGETLTPATPEELADALNGANNQIIALAADTDYGTVAISGTMDNVIVQGAENSNVRMNIEGTAKLNNVTFTDFDVTFEDSSSAYVDGGVFNIDAGAVVKNVKIADSTLTGSGGRSSIVGVSEKSAEITISNCTTDGTKYLVYGSAPIKKLTIENCDIKNHSSWLVMLNAGDSVGAQLTISGNTIDNCTDGIAKYLGSSQPEGAFTVFTNNTVTNSAGHDGSDAKWFTIPGAASTITVSGNTLDGTDWTPGAAQGLGK